MHTCYAVTGWEPARGLLAPGVGRIAVTFLARAEPGILALVSAGPRAIVRVSQQVAAVDGTGVRLRRLDGEQAPAVYAAAPTGRTLAAPPRAGARSPASLGSGLTSSHR